MIDIDGPEPFNRYFGCERREERDIKLDVKERPFYDIFSTGKRVSPLPRRLEQKTTGHTSHILGTTCTLGKDVLYLLTQVLYCALPAVPCTKDHHQRQ